MKISIFKAGTIVCCCLGLLMPLGCSSREDIQADLKTDNAPHDLSQAPSGSLQRAKPRRAAEEEPYLMEQGEAADELVMEELTTEFESTTESAQLSLESEASGPPVGFAGESKPQEPSAAPLTVNVPTGSVGEARSIVDDKPKALRKPSSGEQGSGQAKLRQQTAHTFAVDALVEKQVGGKEGGGAIQEQEIDALVDGQQDHFSREAYDHIEEAPFQQVSDHPLSTFSIDVDTASYSNMRRFLTAGQLPPAGAVRIEELINYFTYNYPEPKGDEPFGTDVEIAAAPWNEQHRLVRIGLQGKKLHPEQRPGCNLVFLIDTSGSMRSQNKLPLVMQSMLLLAEQLEERDSVAIVTYAGSAGVRLPATSGENYEEIASSIHGLSAGGSTNGAGGITLAYQIARDNLIKDGVNRVILATDGDFNVGITNQSELTKLITDEAKSGIFLSVLGYGMGNYNDSTLEKLADQGNGNYAYIDTIKEANKVLREQLFGTLVTIAKDVKIQIEFNPATVSAYRLIGYENRLLKKEDFNDDKKDAGEIGAGHTVTALYEVVPVGVEVPTPKVDALKYQKEPLKLSKAAKSDELITLKLRYKAPDGDTSKLMEIPVKDSGNAFGKSTTDFQFAAAVASFGMKLRRSETISDMSLGGILEIAQSAVGEDESGYRGEFVELVKNSEQLLK